MPEDSFVSQDSVGEVVGMFRQVRPHCHSADFLVYLARALLIQDGPDLLQERARPDELNVGGGSEALLVSARYQERPDGRHIS